MVKSLILRVINILKCSSSTRVTSLMSFFSYLYYNRNYYTILIIIISDIIFAINTIRVIITNIIIRISIIIIIIIAS